jgi:nitrate reductase NapE component
MSATDWYAVILMTILAVAFVGMFLYIALDRRR